MCPGIYKHSSSSFSHSHHTHNVVLSQKTQRSQYILLILTASDRCCLWVLQFITNDPHEYFRLSDLLYFKAILI
jgi:hypothetical protein